MKPPGPVTMTPFRENVVVTLGGLIALLLVLEYTLIYPALPEMSRAFKTTTIMWVIIAGILTAVVSAPLVGKLADMHGIKKVILITCWSFVLGSVLCAIAPSMVLLIIGRVLQGVPMGVLVVIYALFRTTLSKRGASKGIAVITVMIGMGWVLGPLISSAILEGIGWRGVFWFCALYMLIVCVLFTVFAEESSLRQQSTLDLSGAILITVGLGAVYLVVSMGSTWGWTSLRIVGFAILGGIALVLFVVRGLRVAQPLFDLHILASAPVRVPILLQSAQNFTASIISVLLPIIALTPRGDLGYGLGVVGTALAIYYLPYALMASLSGPISGALVGRGYGLAAIRFGVGCSAAGMIFLAVWHAEPWQLWLGVGIVGIGQSAYSSAGYLIADGAPMQQSGGATGVASAVQTFVGGLGVALLTSILAVHVVGLDSAGGPSYSNAGITIGLLVGAAIPMLGVIQSFLHKAPLTYTSKVSEKAETLAETATESPAAVADR